MAKKVVSKKVEKKVEKTYYAIANNDYGDMGECITDDIFETAYKEYVDCIGDDDPLFVYKITLLGKVKKTITIE